MNADQRVKQAIGDYVILIAMLQAENEALKAELAAKSAPAKKAKRKAPKATPPTA